MDPSHDATKVIGTPSKHPNFYFTDVVFLVEGVLFKVHRRNFENDSEVFQTMFSLPIAEGEIADGSSDEHPLVLRGIKQDDFVQLLRVMFPHYDSEDPLTLNQWISVLNLSTMWRFDRLRAIAIRKLSAMLDEPIQRIVLAQTYHVTEWLVPALNALARRAEPLQPADVEQIGVDYALKIAAVRESFGETTQCRCQCYSCYNGHRNDYGRPAASRGATDFSAKIRAVFGAEVLP
ncbi:hypothetical protein CERSUDRAFT_158602 [Gelatoporia subvermispora B]|uniref:BTB domain-containing protein n=1 Tax=Ceriporiopsis subvermispora (strain B) TaxID=914234 RepID=M2R5R4_CERS8|nr:hypothetical protein CERSUDRAFT_158602 [Gelatoporia subvermispora B]